MNDLPTIQQLTNWETALENWKRSKAKEKLGSRTFKSFTIVSSEVEDEMTICINLHYYNGYYTEDQYSLKIPYEEIAKCFSNDSKT